MQKHNLISYPLAEIFLELKVWLYDGDNTQQWFIGIHVTDFIKKSKTDSNVTHLNGWAYHAQHNLISNPVAEIFLGLKVCLCTVDKIQ